MCPYIFYLLIRNGSVKFGTDYQAAYNHFLNIGINEGRTTSPEFNVRAYLALYPDLQAAFGNDLAAATRHFVTDGIKEGRLPGASDTPVVDPGHEHVWEVSKVIVQPTCQADGEIEYVCSCGETKKEVVKASEEYHDYVETNIVREATETETGISVYTCRICGDTDTKITPVLECEHENTTTYTALVATCTQEGKIITHCNDCDKDIKTEIVPMEEHTIVAAVGSGYILQNPVKCEKDGSERVYCTACKQYVTRAIPAHNYEVVSEVPATCTEGKMVTYKCKDCGATKVEEVGKPNDHTITTTITKAPTCIASGLKTEVCSVCGYTVKTVLPALNHRIPLKANGDMDVTYVYLDEDGEEVGNVADYKTGMKSCEYDIAQKYVCANFEDGNCSLDDGEITIVIAKKVAHSVDASKATTRGLISYDEDGNVVKGDDGKIVVTAGTKVDCTHAYAEVFTCATCGKEEYRIITAKTEHAKVPNTENVIPATCTTKGWTTYSCSTCGKTVKDAEIAPLGHDFVYSPATCTTAESFNCTRCGGSIDTEIAAAKADAKRETEYKSLLNKKLAQLKAAGVEVTTTAEAEAYTDYAEALGHDYGENEAFISNGKTYKHCIVCNKDIEQAAAGDDEEEEEPAVHTHTADDFVGKTLTEVTANSAYTVKCGDDCTPINVSWDGSATTVTFEINETNVTFAITPATKVLGAKQ